MIRIFERLSNLLPRQRFVRHVLTLMTGTALAQLITFPLAPILTRLYSPETFGVVAIYTSLAGILVTLVTWRYDLAIVVPEQDEEAAGVLVLSAWLTVIASLLAGLVFLVFRYSIALLLNSPELANWLLVMPLTLALSGFYTTFSYWSTRTRQFKSLSVSQVAQSGATMGSQLGYGFLVNPGVAGLLGGQVFGTLVGAAILIARGLGDSAALFARSMKRKTILAVARKYHEFPKHTISTSFLNTLSVSILPFMLSSTFGTYIAGLTMFAQRLLMAPLQILTQSLWQVAHAQLPAMEWDAQADLLRKLHKYAAFLFAFPLIAIAVLSGFTGTVFGGKWHNLSLVLPCVALMVLISSVSNCTSYFTALGRYRAETVVNVTLMAVRLTSLVLGVRYLGQYAAVNVYAISSVAVYLGINCYWGLRFGLLWTFARNFALSISISVIVLWPVKLLFPKSLPLALSWTAVAGVLYYYLCAPIVKNKPVVPAKDNAE